MINLYSDTQTLPTRAMIDAIGRAELGDDVLGEDPTVRALEERTAELTGMEAGLLVASGTQGNLVSFMAHGGAGDEVFIDANAHAYFYECGSLCSVAGYVPNVIAAQNGFMTADELEAHLRPANVHFPVSKLLWLENTHNRLGGIVLSQERKKELLAVARRHELKVHIDGARIWNASVALNMPVSQLCEGADSIQVCLSKGLSCPVGSLVCGSKEFIDKARRMRKRLGGGMRQAGVIAACGLVALRPEWIARLEEDHLRAKRLAALLSGIEGVVVDSDAVETNMVFTDFSAWKRNSADILADFLAHGLKASPASPTRIRFVTHRHISDEDIENAAKTVLKVSKI